MKTLKELLLVINTAVKNEKHSNAQVVRYLAEAEQRKAYLDWGYGSLYDFIHQGLKYDPASATRRLAAARAAVQLPDIPKKLESGELSLGVIQKVESFRYHEGRERKKRFTLGETRKIYNDVGNLGVAETEEKLANQAKSKHFLAPTRETNRVVKGGSRSITFTIEKRHQKNLDLARELLSHKMPGASLADIYGHVLEQFVNRMHPKRKAERKAAEETARAAKNAVQKNTDNAAQKSTDTAAQKSANTAAQNSTNPTNSKRTTTKNPINKGVNAPSLAQGSSKPPSRYINASERKKLWHHYDGKGCTKISRLTQCRCGSRHRLQIDHIQPFAMGGLSTSQNLRILCQKHNLARTA